MPWLRMQMGGGIGAYCLFMLVLAMSVDELFWIPPLGGFKDKNGMSIGIHCGSVMFHQDDGYSMLYADAPSGKGWHAAEIAGILWDLFLISSIVTSFVAVQISLTPALRHRRKGAMNLFIIGGLCAIIGASCAHADNTEDGKYNVCVEKGRAGSSVFLAFLHGFFLLLAAIFLWLDESEIEPSAQRRAEQSTGAVPRGGEAAYNMETIDLPEEATPELQLAEPKDEEQVVVEQPTLR